jgi:hypothetical protein
MRDPTIVVVVLVGLVLLAFVLYLLGGILQMLYSVIEST